MKTVEERLEEIEQELMRAYAPIWNPCTPGNPGWRFHELVGELEIISWKIREYLRKVDEKYARKEESCL